MKHLSKHFSIRFIKSKTRELIPILSEELPTFNKKTDSEQSAVMQLEQNGQLPKNYILEAFKATQFGSATKVQLDNSTVTIINSDYSTLNPITLYRLLNFVKPDLILLNISPDSILPNFAELYEEDPEQIKFIQGAKIQPNSVAFENSAAILRKSGYLLNQNRISYKQETNRLAYDQLPPITKSLVSIWSDQRGVSLLPAEIPFYVFIKYLSNTLSLIQIQQIFEHVFLNLPQNPDIYPHTSYQACCFFFPDIFQNFKDTYQSALLQNIPDSFKNILFLSSIGQTMTLPLLMEMVPLTLTDLVKTPKREGFLMGTDSIEMLMEKAVLLSLLFKGVEANDASIIKDDSFRMFFRWCVEEEIKETGYKEKEKLEEKAFFLFAALLADKRIRAMELLEKGQTEKEKMFVRTIFKTPNLNKQLE